MVQRAHIVQPVSELHEKNANVLRNGEQQLAQILGLCCLLRYKIKPLDLGKAIHQGGDLRAEFVLDFLMGRFGVFHDVMEQCGCNGGAIKLEFGQNGGHFQGMMEISFARGALLVAMGLHGINIGPVEKILIRIGVITRDPFHQFILPHHAARQSSRYCVAIQWVIRPQRCANNVLLRLQASLLIPL